MPIRLSVAATHSSHHIGICHGLQGIYQQFIRPSVGRCATYREIIEEATAVATLALRSRARLFYFASSEVFGEAGGVIAYSTPLALTPGYGGGKQAAEELVCSLIDDAVVLRSLNVHRPAQCDRFLMSTVTSFNVYIRMGRSGL